MRVLVCSGFTMCSAQIVSFILDITATRWLCKLLFSNNFSGVYFVFGGVSTLRSPRRVSEKFSLFIFENDAFHRGRDDIWMDRCARDAQTQIILFVFWYVKYGWFCCCIFIGMNAGYSVWSADGSSIFELLTASWMHSRPYVCNEENARATWPY